MPSALVDKPELYLDLTEYFDAFWVLCRGRLSSDLGVGTLSLTEIKAYCELFEVDDVRTFVKYITAMDDAYIAKKAGKDGHGTQNQH